MDIYVDLHKPWKQTTMQKDPKSFMHEGFINLHHVPQPPPHPPPPPSAAPPSAGKITISPVLVSLLPAPLPFLTSRQALGAGQVVAVLLGVKVGFRLLKPRLQTLQHNSIMKAASTETKAMSYIISSPFILDD